MALKNSYVVLAFLSGRSGFSILLGITFGLTLNFAIIPIFEQPCVGSGISIAFLPTFHAGSAANQKNDQYQPRIVTRNPEEIAQKVSFFLHFYF